MLQCVTAGKTHLVASCPQQGICYSGSLDIMSLTPDWFHKAQLLRVWYIWDCEHPSACVFLWRTFCKLHIQNIHNGTLQLLLRILDKLYLKEIRTVLTYLAAILYWVVLCQCSSKNHEKNQDGARQLHMSTNDNI